MLKGRKIHDVDLLAIWLTGAELERREMHEAKGGPGAPKPGDPLPLRETIRLAMKHAEEMYTPHNETDADPETSDPEGVKAVLARFASTVDEEIRIRKGN